jgi:hypothetical protein
VAHAPFRRAVLVGLVANIVALSVVGFVFVVGACGYAVQVVRGRRTGSSASAPSGTSTIRTPRQSGLKSRMEERLRRRFDDPNS